MSEAATKRRRVIPLRATCFLPENDSCCCTCSAHIEDHSHPCVDGGRITEKRGYICLAPEFGCAFSGWPKHGLCEMWHPKEADR